MPCMRASVVPERQKCAGVSRQQLRPILALTIEKSTILCEPCVPLQSGSYSRKSCDTSNEILVFLDLRDFWGTLMLIWHYVFQCFGLIGLEMYALANVLATFSWKPESRYFARGVTKVGFERLMLHGKQIKYWFPCSVGMRFQIFATPLTKYCSFCLFFGLVGCFWLRQKPLASTETCKAGRDKDVEGNEDASLYSKKKQTPDRPIGHIC